MQQMRVWYLVDYKWTQRKWKCTNPGQDKVMEATNKAGEIVPLLYLQEDEAMYMLGMYLVTNENNKYQVKYMHKKSTP